MNIKGGLNSSREPNGSREFIRKSVENCVRMLGPKGKIDMFEPARKDPNVPFEETLRALAELVEEGKIGGVALSEVSAATIREAAKITKILAVEVSIPHGNPEQTQSSGLC